MITYFQHSDQNEVDVEEARELLRESIRDEVDKGVFGVADAVGGGIVVDRQWSDTRPNIKFTAVRLPALFQPVDAHSESRRVFRLSRSEK